MKLTINTVFRRLAGLLAIVATLAGCASDAAKLPPPKAEVSYIDTAAFDRSLTSSLGANLERVEVPVDDRISPIAIPDRLNKWLAAVDAGGGSVQVKQVEADKEKTRGFPLVLLGLAVEVVRMLRGNPEEKLYQPAANYDADILVRQGPNGERVIERVVLHRKEAR